jgi:Polyketide cyclase / dehydrase and lipid transport
MLKKIILGVLAVVVLAVAGLVVAIMMQPDTYRVVRTASINAPSEKVFAQVNDFRRWDAWSPWAKIDPAMKATYGGPPSGVGSTYQWVGNDEVGEGKMTIKESHPSSHLKIDLEFIKPFASQANTEFILKPVGDRTDVEWSIDGKHNFLSKAMCLVISMDQMIGPDFEKGVNQLKTVAESSSQ